MHFKPECDQIVYKMLAKIVHFIPMDQTIKSCLIRFLKFVRIDSNEQLMLNNLASFKMQKSINTTLIRVSFNFNFMVSRHVCVCISIVKDSSTTHFLHYMYVNRKNENRPIQNATFIGFDSI